MVEHNVLTAGELALHFRHEVVHRADHGLRISSLSCLWVCDLMIPELVVRIDKVGSLFARVASWVGAPNRTPHSLSGAEFLQFDGVPGLSYRHLVDSPPGIIDELRDTLGTGLRPPAA